MSGVLFDLERLEENAREVERRHLEAADMERKAHELQDKILALQKKRNHLRAELGKVSIQTQEIEITAENKKHISALKHLRNLKEKQKLYRLTGVTVREKTDQKLLLQFDTNYNLEVFEEYYVELSPSKEQDGGYQIQHHTLPAFVPVSQLKNLLQTDLKEFVDRVKRYLSAYVTRLGGIKAIQTQLPGNMLESLDHSFPIDYVQLTVRTSDECPLSVKLTYSDLFSVLPDNAHVSLATNQDQSDILPDDSMLKQWEELLKTQPLVSALSVVTGVQMDVTEIDD